MKRSLLRTGPVVAAVLAGLMAVPAVAEPRLRPSVVVEGPQVMLGDLFKDVGDLAGVRVAPAPEPGARSIIRISELRALAVQTGLDWQPPPGVSQVVIDRAWRNIRRDDFENILKPELVDRGAAGHFEIDLRGRDLKVKVPAVGLIVMEVESLDYDRRTSRFSAVITAATADFGPVRLTLEGQANELIKIPTVNRHLARGDIIRADDISSIEIRADQRQRTIAEEADQLIGLQAKRTLRPDRPVRLSDLQRPILVEKRSLVTMTVAGRFMKLTAVGQALEDGALGDIVRILNVKSNRTIQGQVIGASAVRVITHNSLAAATN